MEDGYADLHIHTTNSDGTATVEERVEQAKKRGLSVISITDHDCIDSSFDSPRVIFDGLEVVTGVEIRANIFNTKIEILGYYVDPTENILTTMLEKVRGYREERNRKIVEELTEMTDLNVTYESLNDSVNGTLGRPHFADILIDEGFADSVSEAFDEYLTKGSDAYVPMERASYEKVIDAIHKSGGVASLAHPGRVRSDRVPEMVRELANYGLDAVEVWYPYGEVHSDDYANIGVEDTKRLAEEHGLLKTGGSDCHGPGSGKFRIGEVTVAEEQLLELRARSS